MNIEVIIFLSSEKDKMGGLETLVTLLKVAAKKS